LRRTTGTTASAAHALTSKLEIEDQEGLEALLKAFSNLDFDDTAQLHLWVIVSAVLHLGNVSFEATKGVVTDVNEACTIDAENPSARAFCHLMGCSLKDLDTALCKRTISIRGGGASRSPAARPGRRPSVQHTLSPQMAAALGNTIDDFDVVKSVRLDDAVRSRDVLAKSLYGGLFEHAVCRTNGIMCGDGIAAQSRSWIGVLDIFGFEFFDVNGFEQLCINYANEKLQQLFTSMFIGKEQVVYICEAIQWHELDFKDNRDVITLMEQQHPCLGVFATLDEVCRTVGGTDRGLVEALCNSFVEAKNPNPKLKRSRYATDDNFVIVHYAASVTYNCSGMLEKNRDAMLPSIKALIQNCSSDAATVIKAHIPDLASDTSVQSGTKLGGLHRTLSSRFQMQIRALLDVLSEASSTFVRCLKSNNDKIPFCIHEESMRTQLVSSGLLDCTRITQMGFPFRVTFLNFMQDNFLLQNERVAHMESISKSILKDMCRNVMESIRVSHDHYKIGTNLIFFKAHVAISLEKARVTKISDAAALLQGCARCCRQRSVWSHNRLRAITLQCCIRSFLSKCCAMARYIAKLILQAYMRSYVVKRTCTTLVSAGLYLRNRLVAAAIRRGACKKLESTWVLRMRLVSSRAHLAYRCQLASRDAASRQLQSSIRSYFAQRAQICAVAAAQYLRGRFVAISMQSRAHDRIMSARMLRMRMVSSVAKIAYLQEMTNRELRSEAASMITAIIRRRLNFRRLLDAQRVLVNSVLRALIRLDIHSLRVFSFEMQRHARRAAARSRYIERVQGGHRILPYIIISGCGLRVSFMNARLGARVVTASVARALSRARFVLAVAAVQPLKAAINRCLTSAIFSEIRNSACLLQGRFRAWTMCRGARTVAAAAARALHRSRFIAKVAVLQPLEAAIARLLCNPSFLQIRNSACVMQSLVRLASIQMLKARMAVMMSKKFLQSRFRRWSVRRRYCSRLQSCIVACSCTARAAQRAHYATRISAALTQMNWLRRSHCQKRLAQKIVAVVTIKSLVKMARARSRFRRVTSASAVLTARKIHSLPALCIASRCPSRPDVIPVTRHFLPQRPARAAREAGRCSRRCGRAGGHRV
jgi:hypothetical protein